MGDGDSTGWVSFEGVEPWRIVKALYGRLICETDEDAKELLAHEAARTQRLASDPRELVELDFVKVTLDMTNERAYLWCSGVGSIREAYRAKIEALRPRGEARA